MTLYKFYKKSNPSVAVAKIVFNHLISNFPIKKIREIAESTSGGTPNRGISEYYGGEIPWIKSGELNDSHITSCEEYITEVGLKNSSAKLYPKGTLVIALYGATVGKTGILDFGAASNQAVCAIYPNKEIDRDYMFWFFRQKRQEFIESSFGGAQPNISQKVVKETDIPVPCIEIQKEIVTFLNQCEYEGRIDKKFLDNGVLEQIESFFNVRSCCEELEGSMNMTHSLIPKLRQSILQEAVQGKIVPQDPNDEPGSVLLEKIKAETEGLIKEKKIKQKKPLSEITKDEIPYELPKGWTWVRVETLGMTVTGKTPPTNVMEYYNGGIPFLNPGNINNGQMHYNGKTLTQEGIKFSQVIPKGSILMVCINGSLKNGIGQVAINDMEITVNQQINALIPHSLLFSKYILYCFQSTYFQQKVKKRATGTVNYIINKSSFGNIVMPLPPLNEQKRIIEKVDQLMALCDELEKTVEQSKQESETLMQVVLQEAFQYS